MSITSLAHLQRIERQTRRDVAACKREGQRVNVTDFYRPLELVQMFRHHRHFAR